MLCDYPPQSGNLQARTQCQHTSAFFDLGTLVYDYGQSHHTNEHGEIKSGKPRPAASQTLPIFVGKILSILHKSSVCALGLWV